MSRGGAATSSFALLVALGLCAPRLGAVNGPPSDDLRTYETRYYSIHTDLADDQAREASIRMTKMAEEYARRTRDFGGTIKKKLPFYLFADPEDYYATGAPRQSAGRFDGTALLAVAEDFGPKTWHIVQHEGFHQFADAAINAHLPPWVNEGLAEYFGEAVFTGDGFVTGVIPQWRLERIRRRFDQGQFKPLDEMMKLPLNAWNEELSLANYDQAWSMAQFLAHGDDGRYQKAFSAFMGALGKGQSAAVAWRNTFGATRGFEEKWKKYWTTLPDNPTADLYAQATTATLTSFLARAFSQRQFFADFGDFAAMAGAGQIRHHPDDWLPPHLVRSALRRAEELAKGGSRFVLVAPPGDRPPQIHCILPDGGVVVGEFALRSGRVQSVTATAD